jgi:hypothetical protein
MNVGPVNLIETRNNPREREVESIDRICLIGHFFFLLREILYFQM